MDPWAPIPGVDSRLNGLLAESWEMLRFLFDNPDCGDAVRSDMFEDLWRVEMKIQDLRFK